jgi:peptidyl-prolyl isomerase G (cyclophilin G)
MTNVCSQAKESVSRKKHRKDRSQSQERSRSRSPNRKTKKGRRQRSREQGLELLSSGDKETKGQHEETEEEYDARLEREEKERIIAQRQRDLEAIKRRVETPQSDDGGVRFKGVLID